MGVAQNHTYLGYPAHPSQAHKARDSGASHGRQSYHRAAEKIFNPPNVEKKRDSPRLLQ